MTNELNSDSEEIWKREMVLYDLALLGAQLKNQRFVFFIYLLSKRFEFFYLFIYYGNAS